MIEKNPELAKKKITMPSIIQSFVSRMLRLYPFYSGCGTLANTSLVKKINGNNSEKVWCRVPGGEILAPLDDYIGRAAYYVGDLDRKIIWICKQIVNKRDTVLDIGANIGQVSVLLSKQVGSEGKVYSFEPNPELYDCLNKVIERNKLLNVSLYPVALGRTEGNLNLRIPKINRGKGSLIRHTEANNEDVDVVNVPVQTLSKVLEDELIESIKLIKIDVEGFEAEVLDGAHKILDSIRPQSILFEFNKSQIEGTFSEQPIFKILCQYGYKFFSIPKCIFKMRLERFNPYEENKVTSNDFLAVLDEEVYNKLLKYSK